MGQNTIFNMNIKAEYKLIPLDPKPIGNSKSKQIQYKVKYFWNQSKATEASYTLPGHDRVLYFHQEKKVKKFPMRFNNSLYRILESYRKRTKKTEGVVTINWLGGWAYEPRKGISHVEILKAYNKTSPSFKIGIQDMIGHAKKGLCCLEVSGYASKQWKMKQHDSTKEGMNYNKELAKTRMIEGAKFLSLHFGLSYDHIATGEFSVTQVGTEIPNFNANQSIMIRSIW